ncbi:MAG: LCP family protein [Candidatus Andersenbacteria bacterium]|nr:LCP family protein [Candidatus Andersenbacteria bacterium]
MNSSSTQSSNASRAEKRVLWEMRERYDLKEKRRPSAPVKQATPPPKPPASHRPGPRRPGKRKHWGLRLGLLVISLLLISGGVFGFKVLSASNKITTAERSILAQLKDLLFSSDQALRGEKEDRINILLAAVGGEGHSGENLADTIMFVSVRPSDHSVAILSIPRDLYVQVPHQNFFSKLNAVHAYGESEKKDGGPALLTEKVEEITGQKIDYFGRVDFVAFKSVVDAVGGVEITVPKTFVDYWHKITFPEGTEKMNGERALAYARARYVEGSEGGDFKRAARQQQLLLAIRDKIFSVNTAFDFTRVNSVLNSLSDNIRTDMQLWEMKRFFEIARQIDHARVHSVVLTTGHNGVLVGGTEVLGGTPASILRTRTGNYSEIQAISQDIFTNSAGQDLKPTPQDGSAGLAATALPSPTPTPEPFTVEVRNGTNTTGLAKKIQDTLIAEKYDVPTIGNAVNRTTAETTVYIVDEKFADEGKKISTLLDANTDSGLPEGEAKTGADILVILGADSQ